MRIVVVGLGYVGVTTAACLASRGHTIVGVDVNAAKVATMSAGRTPIVEPLVGEFVAEAVAAGRLSAATSIPPLDDVEAVIVCVGTPSAADGAHEMAAVAESAGQIAGAVGTGRVTVAFRSTFRPGTMDGLIAPIFRERLGEDWAQLVELVYNPEFLRETTAVADYFDPPKIVLGTADGGPSRTMAALHLGMSAPLFVTGFREAELTKFVDNSWHAVKVAFANEVGRICAAYGVDVATAHRIFASDTKLNLSSYYTRPGGAFGGSCLPKDVRAMQHMATSGGVDAPLIGALIATNETHKRFQLDRVRRAVGPGARVLVVGIAFKAGTDDMRESPHVDLVAGLLAEGYSVRIYDPWVDATGLVGQNLGAIMSEIPRLRELLVDADEVRAEDFDLVVVNSPSVGDLRLDGAPSLDLRAIR